MGPFPRPGQRAMRTPTVLPGGDLSVPQEILLCSCPGQSQAPEWGDPSVLGQDRRRGQAFVLGPKGVSVGDSEMC